MLILPVVAFLWSLAQLICKIIFNDRNVIYKFLIQLGQNYRRKIIRIREKYEVKLFENVQ